MHAVIAENLFERAIFLILVLFFLEASAQNTEVRLNLAFDISTMYVINSTTHITKGCE